ncbi:MAG: hypothetical protein RIM23_10020 [Coleofasciculus sp. G3-WIS-01]|uniref:hypothetical protein n=1 Tax=Coleofasciculus sp. G3-WIS-01 TaxID=3069528 RepID=UPI0032FB2C35
MKIKRLHFSIRASLHSHDNSEEVGFTVDIEDGEKMSDVVAELRTRALAVMGESTNSLYEQRQKLHYDVERLTREFERVRADYETVSNFLKAQGINIADMPTVHAKLIPSTTVHEVTAYLNEKDEDEDEGAEYKW